MMNNPIVEKKDNKIYIIYEYSITHIKQNKKRKLKDGTIKTDTIYTNRVTFPYDLYKLLEITPEDEEKEYIYFSKQDNKIQVTAKPPVTYDEIKKVRLNKRRGFVVDTVDPKTSRRSRLVSLPRNIFVGADDMDSIKYYLDGGSGNICCFVE